mgnify:CR=1 FL=1
MRTPTVLPLLASLLLAGATFPQPASWPAVAVTAHAAEAVGPGVSYDRWALQTPKGPLVVYITTVILTDPHVALAVATHGGGIVGQDEPLTGMADRAHAEAAINADYFDINGSGAPLNVVAIGGRFIHQPDGAAALAVGADGRVTLGPVTLRTTLADRSGSSLQVGAINDFGVNDGLSLLTPEFGGTTDADLEIVLTPDTAVLGSYRVTGAVSDPQQLAQLAPGQVGIAARGADAVGRLSSFASGDVVTLAYDSTPQSIEYAVGGGPMLLQGGSLVTDAAAPAPQETDVRYPVTGAGISADGATLWLVAVDGRAPSRSIGITRPMLGSLLGALGASDAMAFDSGGSTEMAVRHLGDFDTSVVNVPSDGRERAIADALLVLNTAPSGPVARVLLDAVGGDEAVLVGSRIRLLAAAIDADMQPVAVDAASVGYSTDAPAVATVDGDGLLTAKASGRAYASARMGAATSAPVAIDVVGSPDALSIAGYGRVVETGASAPLTAVASMKDGRHVAVDANAVRWSVSGDGRVSAGGAFTGGDTAGVASVTARAGDATATIDILVGEHAQPVSPLADAQSISAWRFSSSAATVDGSVDAAPAPDGTRALHLDYSFAGTGSTRAAYADTALAIGGEPLAFGVDVYGDGNGEWLRGAYRNADGIVDSVTLARRVDWKGWKTLRVDLPVQARWPIVFTRLYAVETRVDSIEAGDLWFRELTAIYAGPAQAASPPPATPTS